MSSLFYGLLGTLNMPWWGNVVYLVVCTHITIVGVTVFLHRNQAHRALDLHPIISHFFRFWLWSRTGMITKAWAAIHRKHHAKCETPEDPHSPQIFGIKTVLFRGAELYRREATNQETLDRYGKGTPDDWLERNVYETRSALGIYSLLVVELFFFGVPGLALWAIQMAWMPLCAAGVINGIGHYWGYRNFECPDAATNITPVAVFLGGEELHNNHHTYPTSAKFSVKPWEFDIGWLYIRIFSLLGLAKVKRVAPQAAFIPGKMAIDMDTVRDLINNRFQVMARYTHDVILPIYKGELKQVASIETDEETLSVWRTVKVALIRESSLIDNTDRAHLAHVLAENPRLNQICQYRERLSQIWDQTTASQKELLEALQVWCQEAEATGIQALKDFSAYLKGYALKPVGHQ